MIAESVKFRGHGCFKNEWAGFDTIKPVNVIIGRNNTGKSHLLDFVSALCGSNITQVGRHVKCSGILDEESLKMYFRDDIANGPLPGGHWSDHGRHFVGVEVSWEANVAIKHCTPIFPPGFDVGGYCGNRYNGEDYKRTRALFVQEALLHAKHKLSGKKFRRLLADRDFRSEGASNQLTLSPNGLGATNIIRRYIHSTDPKLSRNLIQIELLDALNEIFKNDGKFTEIQAKHHDVQGADSTNPVLDGWEVYLGEEMKGLIALSRSGSGLKTVILVLLNLIVIPKIPENRQDPKSEYVFAFEELENNLHPALLRRLFQYLENYAMRERATIFLTTHSSVALDVFGMSKNAQIIRVTNDGESAKAETVSAHFDHLGIISELGAKPSDILQSNGIIWVEGPSDRIYVNHWIELFSDGKFREGRDYQCAFYGGALLARAQFVSPNEAEDELANLFRVNPNIIVVCDGDRTAESGEESRLKGRVSRIKSEVGKIPNAHIWITEAKEIENYLPGFILSKIFDQPEIPSPERCELFFPREADAGGNSYLEKRLNRKSIDKMELASKTCPHMTKEMMQQRFELADQMASIIAKIESWNA